MPKDKPDFRHISRLAYLGKKDHSGLAQYEERVAQTDAAKGIEKLLKPLAQFAEMITTNAEGVYMEQLEKRVDDATQLTATELADAFDAAKNELTALVNKTFKDDKTAYAAEMKSYIADRLTDLKKAADLTISRETKAKADEMFKDLADLARLTPDEIEEIETNAALSVESQIPGLIAEYIRETGIDPEQINGLAAFVKRLLPPPDTNPSVDWSRIRNKPAMGGAAPHRLTFVPDITNASEAAAGTYLKKNADGTYSFASVAAGSDSWERDITPIGTVDGSNGTFTLPESASQVIVYADGIRVKGGGVSYTHSGSTITFTADKQPFSSISVDYLPI